MRDKFEINCSEKYLKFYVILTNLGSFFGKILLKNCFFSELDSQKLDKSDILRALCLAIALSLAIQNESISFFSISTYRFCMYYFIYRFCLYYF